MTAWKTHSRRVVFDQSPWLRVEYHEVELPDGRIIPDWTWIKTPDYINVVVETDTGQFLCFRQLKYAVDEPMLALVGGYIEPGETPLMTAQRELREETGYTSEDWQSLGDYVVDPNRGTATGHLFLARHARRMTSIDSDDLEDQEMLFLSRDELEAALLRGEFKILAWAATVSFALHRISEG
ncbi:MAG TPA: NUDIX hydrolase [Anaerolineales bacterium]|nr:NUDIX hydrolase [Anaerolineales bacterium]